MHLPSYLTLQHRTQTTLADSYVVVAEGHANEADVYYALLLFARQCVEHANALTPVAERFSPRAPELPGRLHAVGMTEVRSGALGLVRDLQDLYQLGNLADITWIVLRQAAQGLRDQELLAVVGAAESVIHNQVGWLRSRIMTAAPQALLAAP